MSRGGGGTEGEKEVEEEVVRTRNQSRRGQKSEQVDALFCFAQPKNL